MTRKRRGRGEGAIYQRADGLWCASVSAGHRSDGKRRRLVLYGRTKAEVQEKLRSAHNEVIREYDDRLLVREYLTAWLATIKTKVAPSTYMRYEQIARLQVAPHLGHIRLAKLAPLHVEQLFSELAKASASARA